MTCDLYQSTTFQKKNKKNKKCLPEFYLSGRDLSSLPTLNRGCAHARVYHLPPTGDGEQIRFTGDLCNAEF